MRSTVRLDILSTAFVYLSFTAYLSNAEIYIVSTTYRVEPIGLLEADFGPPVPELGTEGMLKVAAPEDACQPFTFQDFITPWFALISRQQEYPSSNCTFDVKVMNAQMAGAAAAIVYDNVFENLIIMSKPPGHPSPGIPSVFINQQAGLLLTKLLQVEGQLRVRITPMTGSEWITLLMSLVMVLMALLTFMASFYFVRLSVDWFNRQALRGGAAAAAAGVTGRTPGMVAAAAASRVIQDSGLPAHVLRSLPVIIYERSVAGAAVAVMPCLGATGGEEGSVQLPCSYDEEMGLITDEMGTGPSHINKGEPSSLPLMGSSSSSSEHEWPLPAGAHAGETKRTCAVCLEDYVEGEKVRVLPCLHRFHMQCVDQWLSTRRLCPVCKHDAGKPLAVVTSSLLLQHQGLGLEEGRANDGPATAFASARRRASAGLAMMRTGLISWFTAMAGDMPSVHPTVTQPLLDPPPHSSPHRTRRAHRLGAAAAEVAGDEAGVRDAGTDLELAPEGPQGVQGGGLYFPPSPVGNESSTVISEGVGQPGQQHSLAVALQPTDQQQQQQSNLGLLAGLSQPIQVPGPPTLFAEAGPPVIPPTPPPRLEPHARPGGILWRQA